MTNVRNKQQQWRKRRRKRRSWGRKVEERRRRTRCQQHSAWWWGRRVQCGEEASMFSYRAEQPMEKGRLKTWGRYSSRVNWLLWEEHLYPVLGPPPRTASDSHSVKIRCPKGGRCHWMSWFLLQRLKPRFHIWSVFNLQLSCEQSEQEHINPKVKSISAVSRASRGSMILEYFNWCGFP